MAGRAGPDADDRRVLELRKAGAAPDAIARALDYPVPDVLAALRRGLDSLTQESDEDLQRLEIERLDALQRALWPAALEGKWLAIDRCLAIMERRAHLLQLDRERHEVTHDAIDEIAQQRAKRRGRVSTSKG